MFAIIILISHVLRWVRMRKNFFSSEARELRLLTLFSDDSTDPVSRTISHEVPHFSHTFTRNLDMIRCTFRTVNRGNTVCGIISYFYGLNHEKIDQHQQAYFKLIKGLNLMQRLNTLIQNGYKSLTIKFII